MAFGICEDCLPEPKDTNDPEWTSRMSEIIRTYLLGTLTEYAGLSGRDACAERARKLDRMVMFSETGGTKNE